MGEVSTVGLDIAKSVFQVHGVDADGAVVMRKRIGRAKVLEFFAALAPCLIGIEACPTAHHWGRELQALGHRVRLIAPSYVKAYLTPCTWNTDFAISRPIVLTSPMDGSPQCGLLSRNHPMALRCRRVGAVHIIIRDQ